MIINQNKVDLSAWDAYYWAIDARDPRDTKVCAGVVGMPTPDGHTATFQVKRPGEDLWRNASVAIPGDSHRIVFAPRPGPYYRDELEAGAMQPRPTFDRISPRTIFAWGACVGWAFGMLIHLALRKL